MIGLLDSGTGGECTLCEIRRIYPSCDAVLLKDVKNAPYGTKSREELISIVSENIRTLRAFGADTVIIACCTASCIWDDLPRDVRDVSHPIIDPTVKRARELTGGGGVAVIATDGTVRSGAFSSRLGSLCRVEVALGELVSLVEGGLSDATVTDREYRILYRMLSVIGGFGCDTLILGCTHFPALEMTISEIAKKLGIKNTVSSAREGASLTQDMSYPCLFGSGKTVRI